MKNKLFMLIIGAAFIVLLISFSAFIYLKSKHRLLTKSSFQTLEQNIQKMPQDNFDATIAALKATLSKEPLYAEAHIALGMIYTRKDMLDEALSEYKMALNIKPDFVDIYQRMYLIYKKKGLEDEAKSALNSYEKLRGDK